MNAYLPRIAGFAPFALASVMAGSSLPLLAQAPEPPSVTVASFAGAHSRADDDAMADELAMRLVETRRFRVMPREWLPLPGDGHTPASEATIRQAAADAGVQYVIEPAVFETSERTMSPAAAFGLLMRSRVLVAAPRTTTTYVTVHVTVVDAGSGGTVRTAVARSRASASGLPAPLLIPALLLRGPVASAAALGTRRSAASTLEGGAQHAIADIAATLNLSGTVKPVR